MWPGPYGPLWIVFCSRVCRVTWVMYYFSSKCGVMCNSNDKKCRCLVDLQLSVGNSSLEKGMCRIWLQMKLHRRCPSTVRSPRCESVGSAVCGCCHTRCWLWRCDRTPGVIFTGCFEQLRLPSALLTLPFFLNLLRWAAPSGSVFCILNRVWIYCHIFSSFLLDKLSFCC